MQLPTSGTRSDKCKGHFSSIICTLNNHTTLNSSSSGNSDLGVGGRLLIDEADLLNSLIPVVIISESVACQMISSLVL
jgi:hypothetical protein